MKKLDKTEKIIITIIVILFLILIIGLVIGSNFNNTTPISYETNEQETSRITLNTISYEEIDGGLEYMLYDLNGNYITTVYNKDSIEFYDENPDYYSFDTMITYDFEE